MSQQPGMRNWLPDQVYDNESQARSTLEHLIACYQTPPNPHQHAFVVGVCVSQTQLIGHVGLSPRKGEVEIGYAIDSDHQGRGYATKAVEALSTWAIDRLGLAGIVGVVDQANAASCGVLEKAQFTLVEEVTGQLHGKNTLVRTYRRGQRGRI